MNLVREKLTGHADLSTTQRYMHLSPAATEDAIRLLDTRQSGVELAEKLGTLWTREWPSRDKRTGFRQAARAKASEPRERSGARGPASEHGVKREVRLRAKALRRDQLPRDHGSAEVGAGYGDRTRVRGL